MGGANPVLLLLLLWLLHLHLTFAVRLLKFWGAFFKRRGLSFLLKELYGSYYLCCAR